uniref:TTF-type domain-containing protein n=1 Tax=Latimeria chalumnae TaxID=7897 RepID=H3B5T8_LATCH
MLIEKGPYCIVNNDFPYDECGRQFAQSHFKRKFPNGELFDRQWLVYSTLTDKLFCFSCKLFGHGIKQTVLTTDGFSDWKNISACLAEHEASKDHLNNIQKWCKLEQRLTGRVTVDKINEQLINSEKERWHSVFIQYLAEHNMALRGSVSALVDAKEIAKALDTVPEFKATQIRKRKRMFNYEGHDDVFMHQFKQFIMFVSSSEYKVFPLFVSIKEASFQTILQKCREELGHCLDNSVKVNSGKSNLSISKNEEKNNKVVEEDDLEGKPEFRELMEMLDSSSTPMSSRKSRGQKKGQWIKIGKKKGVAQQISEAEPKALFVHCYGHSLNLACCDAVNKCKEIKTALEITHEIKNNFFKKKKKKKNLAPNVLGIRVLCPTRWTVKGKSLKSVLDNYEVLQKTWIADKDRVLNPETKIRILGVSSQMKSFDFLFGAALGEVLFHHCDNLSTTLQSPEICASEGQNLARMTVVTLKSLSSEAEFKKFGIQVQEMASNQDVDEPQLPRKRKAPSRLEDGTSAAFPSSVEDHYRKIYETGFNIVMSCIKERFEQPGFQTYAKLEQLILKTVKGGECEEEFHYITQLYADLDAASLQAQLQALAANFADSDVTDFMKNQSCAEHPFFSNVAVLIKLVFVIPATNAVSERSFSALRLIKNYLCTTMSQARLNHLMLLHIHKNVTDRLNLLEVANEFVEGSEHHRSVFG